MKSGAAACAGVGHSRTFERENVVLIRGHALLDCTGSMRQPGASQANPLSRRNRRSKSNGVPAPPVTPSTQPPTSSAQSALFTPPLTQNVVASTPQGIFELDTTQNTQPEIGDQLQREMFLRMEELSGKMKRIESMLLVIQPETLLTSQARKIADRLNHPGDVRRVLRKNVNSLMSHGVFLENAQSQFREGLRKAMKSHLNLTDVEWDDCFSDPAIQSTIKTIMRERRSKISSITCEELPLTFTSPQEFPVDWTQSPDYEKFMLVMHQRAVGSGEPELQHWIQAQGDKFLFCHSAFQSRLNLKSSAIEELSTRCDPSNLSDEDLLWNLYKIRKN
eukprot:c1213_g1_i1.p1 GENE.c1213_g1_i1~~c1213_g1_i1.p1  ORF type:complete len:334 (+),score=43.78 c1213_g1_i1:1721-2722(+)